MFPWSGCRHLPLPGVCGNWMDPWNVKRKSYGAQSRGERRRPKACVTAPPCLHKSILAALRVFRGGLVPLTTWSAGGEGTADRRGHRRVGTVSCHGRQLSDSDFLFGDLMLCDRRDRSAQIQGCFPNWDLRAQPVAIDGHGQNPQIHRIQKFFSSSGARV